MSHIGISMQDQPSSPPPRGPRQRGMGLPAAILSIVLLGAVAVGGFLVVRAIWDQFGPTAAEDYPGPGSGSAVVVVAQGDTVTGIANTLFEADVVASPEAFVQATKGDPRANSISPGAYEMLQQMAAADAFELILDPAARYESNVVLPEGLRIDQTVDRTSEATEIPADALWTVLRDPAQGLVLPEWAPNEGDLRAEGFLFPATYGVAKDAEALQVLQAYVDRFNKSADALGLANAEQTVGYSPYETLIVASLVQSEGRPEDFGKVARVIYNRLDPDTWGETYGLLQLDATINYANAESKLNISNKQLQEDGPYNTYTRQGLPPTPINSPGDAAIAAALAPEDGDWLYYVTVDPSTGETKFTDSYDEFLGYKAEFQQWCSDNPGQC
jgi:UPF0755 protein